MPRAVATDIPCQVAPTGVSELGARGRSSRASSLALGKGLGWQTKPHSSPSWRKCSGSPGSEAGAALPHEGAWGTKGAEAPPQPSSPWPGAWLTMVTPHRCVMASGLEGLPGWQSGRWPGPGSDGCPVAALPLPSCRTHQLAPCPPVQVSLRAGRRAESTRELRESWASR